MTLRTAALAGIIVTIRVAACGCGGQSSVVLVILGRGIVAPWLGYVPVVVKRVA